MAIIDLIPGLRTTICVGNKNTTEYDDPDDEVQAMELEDFDLPADYGHERPPCVIRYIEATPGAPYQLHLYKEAHFHQRSHHISAKVTIDGRVITIRTWTDSTSQHMRILGKRSGNRRLRLFTFSPVEIGMRLV